MLVDTLSVEIGRGYFTKDHMLLGFLNNFLLLAGFLLIGFRVAPFIKVEFYGSTNPV